MNPSEAMMITIDGRQIRLRAKAADPTLFKAYDVRGIAGKNLTDKVAYRIGRAAAHYLNVPEIAVGRDMRLSSPQLAASLVVKH